VYRFRPPSPCAAANAASIISGAVTLVQVDGTLIGWWDVVNASALLAEAAQDPQVMHAAIRRAATIAVSASSARTWPALEDGVLVPARVADYPPPHGRPYRLASLYILFYLSAKQLYSPSGLEAAAPREYIT